MADENTERSATEVMADLTGLTWSPDGEDYDDETGDSEPSAADLESLAELFGTDSEVTDEGDGEAVEEEEEEGSDSETPAPADPDPTPELPTLGMPSIPAFEISEDEFDDAMTDHGKFTEVMTRYGEAVAAKTTRDFLSSMGPHVFNIAVGAFDNLSKAQKMFDTNPEFEEHPEAFGKALIAERKANPSGAYGDILQGVEKRMRSALDLRDKVASRGGRRVDARGGAGRVNAPGTGTRGTGGSSESGEDGDPTFAAFGKMLNKRR